MSNRQKAVVSLSLALQTCSASAALISESASDIPHRSDSASTPIEFSVLHKDLLSLLSLLHGSTTKLSLALKPSSPSYTGSLGPAKDISDHISALTHCASLFDPATHGATVIREATYLIKDVIEATRVLVQTFLNIEVNGSQVSTGQAGDEYMVRTGAIHDLIDKARLSSGLSKDNLIAVRKKWTEDACSLEDGLREVSEMIEDAENSTEGEEECGDIDGWDELGLGLSKKMDKDELMRTRKLHAILRLSTLIHKCIISYVLQERSSNSSSVVLIPTNFALDNLVLQSSALLTASDELISTLYTPQDPGSMAKELASFQRTLTTLQSLLVPLLANTLTVEAQMADMNIHETTGKKAGTKGSRIWFESGFEQIHKSVQAFALTLKPNTDNSA